MLDLGNFWAIFVILGNFGQFCDSGEFCASFNTITIGQLLAIIRLLGNFVIHLIQSQLRHKNFVQKLVEFSELFDSGVGDDEAVVVVDDVIHRLVDGDDDGGVRELCDDAHVVESHFEGELGHFLRRPDPVDPDVPGPGLLPDDHLKEVVPPG